MLNIRNNKLRIDLCASIFFGVVLYIFSFYYFDKINNYILLLCLILSILFVLILNNRERSTEVKFVTIALIFGVLFLILTPPFRVTDENVHFIRAYAISNGDIIPKTNENGELYVNLPVAFIELFQKIGDFTNHFDSSFRYSLKSTIEGFSIYGFTHGTESVNSVANGSPLVYFPQVIAILLCKIFGFPILLAVYLGRFLNLLIWAGMVFYGIKIAPFNKNILLLISLTPMLIHQSASVSSDAITNGICFLFICYIFNLKYIGRFTRKNLIILILFSISMALIKFPYFVLISLILLIPKKVIGDIKRYLQTMMLIIIPGILVFLFWNLVTSGALLINKEGVNPGAQLDFILHSPIEYAKIQVLTIVKLFPFYIESSLVGIFGGGKELPEILGIIPIAILILGLIDNRSKITLNFKNKLFIAFLFFTTVLLIFLPLYIQYSPVAFQIIDGVQGRYFIPIITLLVPIISNIKIRNEMQNLNKLADTLVVGSLFIASLSVVQIYY